MKNIKNIMLTVCVQILLLCSSAGAVSAEVLSTTFYHNDALGSPVAATDEQGNVKWRENYHPYGDKVNNDIAAVDNSRWYTSHPHDQATGLTYAGARYYDPVVGRFMGIDPVGFHEGNIHSFNRFAYTNNNPYRFVDPDGRNAVFLEGVFIFGGAFLVSSALPGHEQRVETLLQALIVLNESDNNSDEDISDLSDAENTGNNANKPQKEPDDSDDQIKRLTPNEIKKLKKGGEDAHDLKGSRNASRRDLFKNRNGDIEVRPKSGVGPGEPTGLNINNFK